MSGPTTIEWTDITWNPSVGCTKVSPGCDHCYAERITERFHGRGSFETVRLHRDRLDAPLHWRAPRTVFVNSMSDLFHVAVPAGFIGQVWSVMADTPRHTYQVLSKRAERMERVVTNLTPVMESRSATASSAPPLWPLPLSNVWLGVSVESPLYYGRIRHLQRTPAALRFLSCEPLLHALPNLPLAGIGWVIAGGESGPGARPCHPDWVRDIRDQCARAGIPFLFKQWGAWRPIGPVSTRRRHLLDEVLDCEDSGRAMLTLERTGYAQDSRHEDHQPAPGSWWMERVGKKAAGRELDGIIHDGMPPRHTALATQEDHR